MMIRQMLFGAVLLSLTFTAQAISETQHDSPLKDTLGDEVFDRCGLDRLDGAQLEALAGFVSPPADSYVAQSAVLYLEREGWHPIVLHRAYRADPERELSDIRHLASVPPDLLVLETSDRSYILPPGTYLAKRSAFQIEILDPRGEVRRYMIERRS
jgi:hypothetical protein